jgi:hypothetical protein
MLLATAASYAAVVQTVYLKNGSVLTGYVQQQDKKENITFSSDYATICIPGNLVSITDSQVAESKLASSWVKWAETNKEFLQGDGERVLSLSSISFLNCDTVIASASTFENTLKAPSPVRILEKGAVVKYLEQTPNTYQFNWSEVESIKGVMRTKEALSGIDRAYQLSNGQIVQGQYAGETYSTLSLYNSNGVIETFNIDDVVRYEYRPINPNQSISEQSELLDVVYTKSGVPIQGIIIERNFTKGNNYLVIQTSGGTSQVLKFADVSGYSKVVNPDYKPKYDILLDEGALLINRQTPFVASYTRSGSSLVLDEINTQFFFPREGATTRVEVEIGNPKHLPTDNYMIVKVQKEKVKKGLMRQEVVVYSFSTDLYEIEKYDPTTTETSVNNTTKLTFDLAGQGVFALYDQRAKKVMPFVIK